MIPIPLHIQKSWFRSWSRDFCQFLEGFGVGLGEFGLGKKVSVLDSENLVSEKSFGFGEFGPGKKVLVSVSGNLVSEKSIGFSFGKFGLGKKSLLWFWKIWPRKKVSVLVLVKISVSSFSG